MADVNRGNGKRGLLYATLLRRPATNERRPAKLPSASVASKTLQFIADVTPTIHALAAWSAVKLPVKNVVGRRYCCIAVWNSERAASAFRYEPSAA